MPIRKIIPPPTGGEGKQDAYTLEDLDIKLDVYSKEFKTTEIIKEHGDEFLSVLSSERSRGITAEDIRNIRKRKRINAQSDIINYISEQNSYLTTKENINRSTIPYTHKIVIANLMVTIFAIAVIIYTSILIVNYLEVNHSYSILVSIFPSLVVISDCYIKIINQKQNFKT